MRRLLSRLGSRTQSVSLFLSTLATVLALVSLALAGYVVYHLFFEPPDVWLSYSSVGSEPTLLAPLLGIVAATVVFVLARKFRSIKAQAKV